MTVAFSLKSDRLNFSRFKNIGLTNGLTVGDNGLKMSYVFEYRIPFFLFSESNG